MPGIETEGPPACKTGAEPLSKGPSPLPNCHEPDFGGGGWGAGPIPATISCSVTIAISSATPCGQILISMEC